MDVMVTVAAASLHSGVPEPSPRQCCTILQARSCFVTSVRTRFCRQTKLRSARNESGVPSPATFHSVDDKIGEPIPEVKFVEEFDDDKQAPNTQSAYNFWSAATESLAGSATFAFLLLQLPQIILNGRNLMAGNNTALFAIPWMGLLTGLAGNLSLLSYFAEKKENGAMLVQAVGVLSTYIVLVQQAIAGAMPSNAFVATSVAVLLGYVINFANYKNLLPTSLWRLWQELITVGGVSVLSQVMWSTFEPYLPPTVLPGSLAFIGTLVLVVQERRGKLPRRMSDFVRGLAAWSATLLFMWSPVSQMWTNISNPANLKGLSVMTLLLAMIGNGLLLPRALFTRDLMWFTGSSWGALVQGWGILFTMYIYRCVSGSMFFSVTTGLALWFVNMLVMDSRANRLSSAFTPLVQLIKG